MNEKSRGEKFQGTIAHKVVKYSKVKVRVIGSHGPKIFQGKGKEVQGLAKSNTPEPLSSDQYKIPQDNSDVYSSYKAVKRAISNLVWGKPKTDDGVSQIGYDHVT